MGTWGKQHIKLSFVRALRNLCIVARFVSVLEVLPPLTSGECAAFVYIKRHDISESGFAAVFRKSCDIETKE